MITVVVKPKEEMRYPTAGDWQWFEGNLIIMVMKCNNPMYELLLAIHEIIEAVLCQRDGITGVQVDDWDMTHLDDHDPGSLNGCPYLRQHAVATDVEYQVAKALHVDWEKYTDDLEKLTR